ncbi:pleckstrin homology domain-containing family M member 1 [Syngnathoides biaculeatus]|uniref:pleckstrin homology domain-containing family M member 1 n=1 Tax=Syngnathoides biaculeatus TaxID=300417 RepID=UPI002ADD674B|nr:pleckstrin homology domain-containing family M member 1 [Syngnathoides biaculeatus]
MLATQTPDAPQEAKHVKQIKEKLAQSLKTLQKRYVTSDAVVTSEDCDANLLCSALEAIFVHGIKGKYVRWEASRSRKGDRGPLPQPFFWSLLKTVTHRDVITELEKINFVGTDVGRCRAWLRLALNHGLLECYLTSLFRESSALRAHYQPGALLLNSEEREVLLSYLQGLASLTFDLSYKSAVLNQWTTTPLSLAGLCDPWPADPPDPPVNVRADQPVCKDSWDTVSQLSGASDPGPALGRASGGSRGGGEVLNSSTLSLDTTDSSQLSSSLSSDSLLQGQDPRSPASEQWSSCDLGGSTKVPPKESAPKLQDNGNSSQDSMREDSFVSSPSADHFSDSDQPPSPAFSDTEPPAPPVDPPLPRQKTVGRALPAVAAVPDKAELDHIEKGSKTVLCRDQSADSLTRSRCWISEEDIYKPRVDEESDHVDQHRPPSPVPPPPPPPPAAAAPADSQAPPSVVHRRQIGLSNPFRGLLKLGHLERRGAMGMWRDHYCELSPFEFRLYLNAEERTCCDNCSLLRCEDARLASPDGRFELAFPGKRLHLRAANRDEAEDWLDRVVEAVNKCRPVSRVDEQWEILEVLGENCVEDGSVSFACSTSCSPERGSSPAPLPEFNWTRVADLERDAIKEAVLYCCPDADARSWMPLVFSLSLEALKGFQVHEGRKSLRMTFPIQEVRDVVPDVALGGPNFFKLLTLRETFRLRAETAEEAHSWRALIRGALDSYLESAEEGEEASAAGHRGGGNLYRLVQHRLKEDGALLVHLCNVPSLKGLDVQSFKCAGCPQQIGPSLGRARLCEFSGQYYCDSCHCGDTTIIPSRMLHNWDLNKREVSKKALWLLAQVDQEPLLNLDQLNPDLPTHSDSMGLVHKLRLRLRLLGDYLLTCRSRACKMLQARMEQRTYLLESSSLYSVRDLREIAEEQYTSYLASLCQFASSHVFRCDLCTQRGFICQMCHSDDIIFPFQFDSTARCKECKAVFHRTCMAPGRRCPRCLRMRKYLERDLQD